MALMIDDSYGSITIRLTLLSDEVQRFRNRLTATVVVKFRMPKEDKRLVIQRLTGWSMTI